MRILINDHIDLQADFGTTMLRDHWKAICTPPALKSLPKTEWKDEHGIDYDVSTPVFEARTLSIPFYSRTMLDYQSLVGYLEMNIENTWWFEKINHSYTLRMTGSSKVSQLGGGWWFTLTFSEDKPMSNLSYSAPMCEYKTGYTLDDIDFGYYGVKFLKGYLQDLEKPFPIKQNLKISSSATPGLQYPDKETYYAAKSVKLPAIFSGRYKMQMLDALLWALTREGYRTFADRSGEEFLMIYKGIEVVDILPGEWLKVNLSFELLVETVFDVLADKAGNYLVDENNNTLSDIL